MRMFRGYHIFVSFAVMAISAVAVVERGLERIATFVLSLFAPAPFRIATDGPDLVLREDHPSLSASLLEGLRHEKGVPRFGAARNV